DYVVTNLSVLKQEDIERLLDIRKRVAQFLGNRRDVLSMLALCAFLSSSRQQVEDTITILRLFLRDMFILRQGVSGQDMNILINRDMASLLGQLAQRNNYDTLEGYERVLAKAEAMLDRNVKPEMVTDMLLLFWLQLA
ncbi:MAG: hypothetical protein GXO58_02705, partial [Thermodesulfobacteria bacterium]|nr:hypothetical protein [Thermodesulfobacteriota bacterium]